MSDLSDKLKIGKHYSMERFGIMTAMAMVLVFGLVIWGATNTYRENKARDMYQVIYQGSFSTSATGAQGSLLGVFEDESRQNAALLFYFPSMSSLSNQASDYTAEVHGMKDEMNLGSTSQPITKGSCVVYGSSGYFIATLHSDRPFEREMLQVMIGDNSEKIPQSRLTGNESLGELYDLWYVIVNLGGDGIYDTSSFDAEGNLDADRFFQEIIVAQNENTIRNTLYDDVKAMGNILDSISDAERRVASDGVNVDDYRPSWVAGDSVVVDENGNYVFKTSTVALGGFDFDWYYGSISDGYIADIAYAAGFDDVKEYLRTQTESQKGWEYTTPAWALSDGTPVILDDKVEVSVSMADIASDVKALDEAYASYADAKTKYQIDDLTSLLQLEIDSKDRGSVFTVNADEFLAYVS